MNCKIGIRGLSNGEHPFHFKVDGSFFEAYESDTVSDAELDINVLITKEPGRMSLDLGITGDVTVKCDRCLADLKIPVDIQVPFSVMFSSYAEDAEEGVSDEVILLDGSSSEIDLGQIIYDYVNLSLPIKKVHPDGECDPEMMEKLKDILK
ncbi:predicted metal-binding possibly nucleic acid-binding protein [Alistipes sp. CAG:831]|nr:predicted metal-binding possibly nucleic acid-binding protein [Alistipes sp. CAG:831]